MATSKKKLTKEVKEEQNEVFELVEIAKNELMEKKKGSLPRYIKKRKKEFLEELERYKILKSMESEEYTLMNKTIPMLKLSEYCFSPFIKVAGVSPKYSPAQLDLIFDYYKECIQEMNEKDIFPPTKEQFCNLCGISTEQFSDYKTSSSKEMREVLLKVEDYIANFLTISGLTRKTDTVTGIFIQKSSLGRKEATDIQQQTNNNTLIVNDSDFMELLNKYNYKK